MSHLYSVLVVDDDLWQCASYRRILESEGMQVRFATSPHQAFVELDEWQPDVIVLDIILDGNTAFTLLHELQSSKEFASIPVVLCSNMGDLVDAKQLTVYGVRRVIDKADMHPADIVAAIKAVTS